MTTNLPPMTLAEAAECAKHTDYAQDAVEAKGKCACGREIVNAINWADAAAFFLEGYEHAGKLETSNMNHCIKALDRIASDLERMKRQDMVQIASESLVEIGAWRKALPGEFCRNGTSYGFPGRAK